jgi:transposase
MSQRSKKAKLQISEEDAKYLQKIAQSRKEPQREVQRARILMKYSDGESITGIQETLNISRPSVYKCIDKALAMGLEAALKDKYHRPKEPVITEAAKAWVINLACTKPKDYGYAAEIWSRSLLALHARRHGPAAGHDCLKTAVKATIQRILKQCPLRPHKIKYYLEKRDADFERKMQEILVVYKEVNVQNELAKAGEMSPLITVSTLQLHNF